MGLVRVGDRPALVEQPVDAFGEDVAELLGASSVRGPERIIGILPDGPGDPDGLDLFVAISRKNQSSL